MPSKDTQCPKAKTRARVKRTRTLPESKRCTKCKGKDEAMYFVLEDGTYLCRECCLERAMAIEEMLRMDWKEEQSEVTEV